MDLESVQRHVSQLPPIASMAPVSHQGKAEGAIDVLSMPDTSPIATSRRAKLQHLVEALSGLDDDMLGNLLEGLQAPSSGSGDDLTSDTLPTQPR